MGIKKRKPLKDFKQEYHINPKAPDEKYEVYFPPGHYFQGRRRCLSLSRQNLAKRELEGNHISSQCGNPIKKTNLGNGCHKHGGASPKGADHRGATTLAASRYSTIVNTENRRFASAIPEDSGWRQFFDSSSGSVDLEGEVSLADMMLLRVLSQLPSIKAILGEINRAITMIDEGGDIESVRDILQDSVFGIDQDIEERLAKSIKLKTDVVRSQVSNMTAVQNSVTRKEVGIMLKVIGTTILQSLHENNVDKLKIKAILGSFRERVTLYLQDKESGEEMDILLDENRE